MKGEYKLANNIVGVVTKELLDKCTLFTDGRVKTTYPMSISKFDKTTFTTLKSLYECNVEIYKSFLSKTSNISALSAKSFSKDEQDELLKYTIDFWDLFILSFREVNKFISEGGDTFRSDIDRGNILFRPISLYPFVHCVCYINIVANTSFVQIFKQFAQMNREIKNELWSDVIWNTQTNKMIMSNEKQTLSILKYLYDKTLIDNVDSFIMSYSKLRNINIDEARAILERNKLKRQVLCLKTT